MWDAKCIVGCSAFFPSVITNILHMISGSRRRHHPLVLVHRRRSLGQATPQTWLAHRPCQRRTHRRDQLSRCRAAIPCRMAQSGSHYAPVKTLADMLLV